MTDRSSAPGAPGEASPDPPDPGAPGQAGHAPLGRSWADLTVWMGRGLVAAAILGTVVALVLLQRFGRTYGDALDLTEQSAALAADSQGPVQALADDVALLTATIVEGLDETRNLLATAQTVVADLGTAAEGNLSLTATGAADIADRLAAITETIERLIPGDSQSAAEELRAIADGLGPTADQLEELGRQLGTAAGQLGTADEIVADLALRVEATAEDLGELDPVLDELATAATELELQAAEATDRLGTDLWLLRVFVVLNGLIVACIGMIVERLVRVLEITAPPVV